VVQKLVLSSEIPLFVITATNTLKHLQSLQICALNVVLIILGGMELPRMIHGLTRYLFNGKILFKITKLT
jgi:hypothetical protein